jgi:hypothetical protein
MPLERFLRIISAKECARSVSATNSVYFDGRKAASTRDKIGLRKLALLLPYQQLGYWLRMQSAANPSLPAIWEMQGDFAKMQGGAKRGPAKSSQIS